MSSPIIAVVDPTMTVVITALIAAALTFTVVKFLDRLRKKDAESEARTILERADREAINRRREAELEIKERALQQKAKTEEELGKIRDELRERERLLDKRQEMIEQQTDDLRKQERIVENTQRRLTERLEDASRRNEELSQTARHAAPDAARLERIDPSGGRAATLVDARNRIGSGNRVDHLEAREADRRTVRLPGSRDALDGPASVRGRPHGGEHDQHGRHPERRNERTHHRPRGSQHPRL